MIDPRLEEFATETQKNYIKAIKEHGTARKAGRALGVANDAVSKSMRALVRQAAAKGYSPAHDMTRPAPVGFAVKGTSTLYDADGKVSAQWVKTNRDQEQTEELLREFVQSLCQDIKPLAPSAPVSGHADNDLLAVYPMGDPHYGMKAWWQDAGDNFDLEIAEKMTHGAIDRLVSSAPAASTALVLCLGDLLHANNQTNQTTSGHQLDVDGRWTKVLRVAAMSMIYCVKRALEKHERVIFRINRGNHDRESGYAVALIVDCYFHLEPRVEVDLSPGVCWYHQFGSVLIGSTHGDTIKGANLVGVMAADEPAAWGQTRHRYWYVGHVHHQDVKEYAGGTVEYFRTLAARDAWHQGQGYRAGRDMRLIVLHREHGEIERHRCDVAMVQ
jgi:hypothetical protein